MLFYNVGHYVTSSGKCLRVKTIIIYIGIQKLKYYLIDHIIQVCNFSLRKITILWLLSFQNFYKFWIFLCDFLTPVTSGQSRNIK